MIKLTSVLILLLSLSSTTFAQSSESYDKCCVCVGDPNDKDVDKECQKWFTLGDRRQTCEKNYILESKSSTMFPGSAVCRTVEIYGAFHGLSSYSSYPFKISKNVAQSLRSEEVIYDGSTCLIFNNVQSLGTLADRLARELPQTKFAITGNQNIGIVAPSIPFITKTKEKSGTSSKVTITIDRGAVEEVYDDCSPAGRLCGFAAQDLGAISDSNTKYCMEEGKLVEQQCCSPKRKLWGKWSWPGESCLR
jgi:hypothetical protein